MTALAARPLSVLVVDDESSALTFLERVLGDAGYQVAGASTSADALALVRDGGVFDLFVLDVLMPEMRGDELASHLRQLQPRARILYVTGFSDQLFEHKPTLSEYEAFLDKPTTIEGLLEAVSLILHGHLTALEPTAPPPVTPADRPDALLDQYYTAFNERRFHDAAALLTADAEVELIPLGRATGAAGYMRFAELWTTAFSNSTLSVERIESRGQTLWEVYLLARGTHRGVLDFGAYRFRPTGTRAVLHLRELLDIRHGRITASMLTVDLNDLTTQLVTVDVNALAGRLDRLRTLSDELAQCVGDMDRHRDVIFRLGLEVDAARRTLRPYFKPR